MTGVTRRLLLAGGAGVAATVAAGAMLRKQSRDVPVLAADPAREGGHLQDLSALVATDPPIKPPPFDLIDAAGAAHTVAEFAGRGIVLNLWATWCVPCVAELPSLAALARLGAAEGIVVLPLSSDRGGAAVVQTFYAGHAIAGLGVWLDPKGEAARALAARGVPTTIVIDRQGRERARLEGGADWGSADALAAIRRLVG